MEVKEKLVENVNIVNTDISNTNSHLSEKELTLIRDTVAQGATEAEFQQLLYLANTYGLNPLKNELWFIKKPAMTKVDGRWTYKRNINGSISYEGSEALLMTSRDGYLKIAQTHEDFKGLIAFEVREGDYFSIDAANFKIEHRYGEKRGRILGAWARCEREGKMPVICYANYNEYHRPGNYAWTKFPSAMIKKVAEVMAMKRAFNISGLVTKEEMGYRGPFSQNHPKPASTANAAVEKAIAEIRQLRTLYQLNKYVQALPTEVKQEAQLVILLQQRRRDLVQSEKNRPATPKQMDTLANMAWNRCITEAERSSILTHMRNYSYYTASIQIKSLSDCIRNRGMRRVVAA